MKVLIDRGKCQGYGNCALAEPRVFDLDEEGLVTLVVDDPPEELLDQVKQAVRACPVHALGVED